VGVDNLGNSKYFLYHPFPQRTYYAELKYVY
jgi:iron complex outermembrane receptor protein